MSHHLYSTVLKFNSAHGFAKLHGVMAVLDKPPAIPGLRVVAIDYIPEVGMRNIMCFGERWREMTAEEVRAADVLLVRLTS